MEPVIKQGIGGEISTYHWENEAVVVGAELSNVTATVYSPGGATLVAETSVTPAGDGKMFVSISESETANAHQWCRAHFKYTYAGQVETQDVYFHIARTDFDIPLHYDDLVKFQPDIGDYAWSGDSTFHRQRDTASMELYARLLNAGHRPWLIINRSALSVVLARLWLAHIYETLSNRPGDEWDERARAAREAYDVAFLSANILEREDSANVSGLDPRPQGQTVLRRG